MPGLERSLLRLFVAMLSCLVLLPGWAHAQNAEIGPLQLERTDEGLIMSAHVRFELPPVVEDALQKGIPLFFVADAALLRERWYWYDREVTSATRHMRLSYHPLTRRWRLMVSSTLIGNPGLALGQTFETRDEALAAVQRISRWKLVEPADLEPDTRYTVAFRFRLDVSQLPRPFQIGVVGQADWNIAAARSARWPPEGSR